MLRHPLTGTLLAALAPAAYLLLCAGGGALLGYPLLLALHGSMPLHVLIGRCSQGLLFLGMWPITRRAGLRASDFGFPARLGAFFKQVGLGFGLGAAMLGLHALALVLLDIRVVNPERIASAAGVQRFALNALLTGFAVAFLEEPLFRGFLLGSLAKAMPKFAAVAVCSLYFAVLHFLKTGIRPEFAEVQWYTGFPVAFDAFTHLFQRIQFDSFLALFGGGVLLCLVRLMRPGNLGYCVGMHAGWVFVIKFTRSLTKGNPNESLGVLVGGYDGVIGYLSASWIAVLIVLLWVSNRTARPINSESRFG